MRIGWLLILVVALVPWLGLALASQQPDQAPTTRVVDCLAGGCHAEQTAHWYLHGPVASGTCEPCHDYANVEQHKFVKAEDSASICGFCHPEQFHLSGLQVHEPVAKGECLKCHDPHGSSIRGLLPTETRGELCVSCHEKALEHTFLHSAVGAGMCSDCHESHASLRPKLLVDEPAALCVKCHEQPVADESRSVHEATLTEDCTRCHKVGHGSEDVWLLRESPIALCTSCHESTLHDAVSAPVGHSVVTADYCSCLTCHTSHSSEEPFLLHRPARQLCMNCHEDRTFREGGARIAAVAGLDRPGSCLHGPITESRCQDCHTSHGGTERALLTKPYTTKFLEPFSLEPYALCFECHDSRMVTEQRSTESTGFRNGDANLHFIHVQDNWKQGGHTCRVCHAPHRSDHAALTRVSVPFGGWEAQIEFQRTDDGGRCAAGCHRAFEFNRKQPIDYDARRAADKKKQRWQPGDRALFPRPATDGKRPPSQQSPRGAAKDPAAKDPDAKDPDAKDPASTDPDSGATP